jgi:hypothetical protein
MALSMLIPLVSPHFYSRFCGYLALGQSQGAAPFPQNACHTFLLSLTHNALPLFMDFSVVITQIPEKSNLLQWVIVDKYSRK